MIDNIRFSVTSPRRGQDIPKFIPLRYRFIFITTSTLFLILSILAVSLSFVQSRNIRQQLEQRGISIAQSLAAASIADLMTYDYISLDRSANQAAQDPGILYVIFHDKEGRVAGFNGKAELQHKFLEDAISQNILSASSVIIQKVWLNDGGTPGLDIAVPVFPPGQQFRWGTVRVCLSMVPMQRQIRQTQWTIFVIGFLAISVGTFLSIWAARRITRPLAKLVRGTQEAAKGNLKQHFKVETGDEVEVLASNFSVMIQEILSHRSEMERQLREIKRLQRYTDQLLTTMADGLISVSMNRTVSTMNPAAQRLLETDHRHIQQGDSLDDVLAEFTELKQYIDRLLTDPAQHRPYEIYRQCGEEDQVLLVGSSVLSDRGGQPQEVIINLHDITSLKQLEASVRQSERLAALGTLAAGMAHEIRNPLSTIKTFVQLLPRKVERPSFLTKFQRTVPRELERINQLVQELLELSRLPKFKYQLVDIHSILTQTLEMVGDELRAHRIDFECDIAKDVPHLRADADQLFKAFCNVLTNAIQAMPDGGRLYVKGFLKVEESRVEKQVNTHKWLNLIFRDTGAGIESEVIHQIFNPFFTTKDMGTGLGLAITHKVIAEHGGKIDVTSQVGKGTQFCIRLPLTPY